MRAKSVDLVLSDLPSGETQAAFDRRPPLDDLWAAVWHVLKPDGWVVFMASSLRFASQLYESQPRAFRYDLIWQKSIATGFLNAKLRPLRAHEFILVFSRRLGVYTPQMTEGATPILRGRVHEIGSENYGRRSRVVGRVLPVRVATDRYPRSVLTFRSVPNSGRVRVHPQQKPEELLRWLVRTYSERGDLVADPFAGSGSTGRAAASEERRFIGYDKSPRFGGRWR